MENSDNNADIELTFWAKHRFLLLIGLSIMITFVFVVISMGLYTSSGAAQLDLSRPGYKAISSQAITNDNDFEDYPAFGSLDTNSVNEFKVLFEREASKATAVDAFSGDPLDPETLEISAPTK